MVRHLDDDVGVRRATRVVGAAHAPPREPRVEAGDGVERGRLVGPGDEAEEEVAAVDERVPETGQVGRQGRRRCVTEPPALDALAEAQPHERRARRVPVARAGALDARVRQVDARRASSAGDAA